MATYSGGVLNVANWRGAASNAGTQSACLSFGGTTPLATASALNEEYDGSTWTAVGALNTGRYLLGGSGTSTAALACGGKTPGTTAVTEEYGGSSWVSNPSPSGDLGLARYSMASLGTQTASLICCGDPYTVNTEEYNGTTWTEVNNYPVTKYEIPGAGTQTAAIIPGGNSVPGHSRTTTCFEYDGTSWAATGALGTAGGYNSIFGIQTDAKLCGNNPSSTLVQDYDGTSWTVGTALATARMNEGSAGISTAGVVIGGGPTAITTVEEFSLVDTIQTITST